MDDFKDSPTALVADVDCTAGGKDLCEKYGVQGFPTIKYGDPAEFQDYNGGRSYEELKKFADENLGPTCGPANLDLCEDGPRAKIEKFMGMTVERLENKITQAVRVYQEELPLMKKVVAHMKKPQKEDL